MEWEAFYIIIYNIDKYRLKFSCIETAKRQNLLFKTARSQYLNRAYGKRSRDVRAYNKWFDFYIYIVRVKFLVNRKASLIPLFVSFEVASRRW